MTLQNIFRTTISVAVVFLGIVAIAVSKMEIPTPEPILEPALPECYGTLRVPNSSLEDEVNRGRWKVQNEGDERVIILLRSQGKVETVQLASLKCGGTKVVVNYWRCVRDNDCLPRKSKVETQPEVGI